MRGSARGGQQLRRRSVGQAMVVSALALVALLAFVGLVLNMGLFFVERRHLQNAADAMALAATWQVLDEQTSRLFRDVAVSTEAQRVATENQVTIGAQRTLSATYVDQAGSLILNGVVGNGTMPPDAAGVRINLSGPFDTLLAGFVGRSSLQVSAEGEARLISVAQPASLSQTAGLTPLVPLAVPLNAYQAAINPSTRPPPSTAYDLYNLPSPYLDMTTVTSGGSAAPSFGDMHTNLQYWSDGSHQSGTLIVGSQVAFAGTGYASDVQTGLSDNARRQGLPTDLSLPRYIVISVPLCLPCSAPTATIVGFARFNLASSQIGLNQLVGWFVPFVNDPAAVTRSSGSLWGPSAVVLTH